LERLFLIEFVLQISGHWETYYIYSIKPRQSGALEIIILPHSDKAKKTNPRANHRVLSVSR
jgi:hypothetical protein